MSIFFLGLHGAGSKGLLLYPHGHMGCVMRSFHFLPSTRSPQNRWCNLMMHPLWCWWHCSAVICLVHSNPWLPDGDSRILRLYVFGHSGLKDYGSATLPCKIWSLPFLGLGPHALHPGTIQVKEGIKFCYLSTLSKPRWSLRHLRSITLVLALRFSSMFPSS